MLAVSSNISIRQDQIETVLAFSLATVLVLTFITGVPWWIRAVASYSGITPVPMFIATIFPRTHKFFGFEGIMVFDIVVPTLLVIIGITTFVFVDGIRQSCNFASLDSA